MILMDTHVLLWWIHDPRCLSPEVMRKIKHAEKEKSLAISAITIWEIALLIKKGRLTLAMDLQSWIDELESLSSLQILIIDHWILFKSALLPEPFHPDPADRIIVATAMTHQATLLTKDSKILSYPHVTSWWM